MRDGCSLTHVGCQAPSNNDPLGVAFLAQLHAWQCAFEANNASMWAIYIENPIDFAAALFGAWHAGKTVVLPSDDRPATLDALTHMGCRFAGNLPSALQANPPTKAALSGHAMRRPLDPQAAQLMVFTSGSQGQPQAIPKTLAQLSAEVVALEETFAPQMGADSANDALTIWATVSHQHIYGLLFLVLWPLAAGRPIGPKRLLYPEDILHTLSEQPCILVTTPAHLKRLGGHLDWSKVHAGLRLVFSSGGPLPSHVSVDAAHMLGVTPIEVFGSSETGGIAWRSQENAQQDWTPLKGVKWRLKEGCLSISSPWMPDAAWWDTTDLAAATSSGSFRLLGRQDHIVKIEEKRISLTAIERALMATPWVQEAKVVVIPTAIGDRVGAVVVASQAGLAVLHKQAQEQQAHANGQGQGQGRRALVKWLRDVLQTSCDPLALPKRWRFVAALPVDAQGKTPTRLLTTLFAEPSEQTAAMPSMHTQAAPTLPEMPPLRWLKREPQEALVCLDIQPGLSAFNGHFPQAPILPGVAQLDWALTLGQQCFSLPTALLRLEAIKFVKPVTPGTQVYLALSVKDKQADVKVLHFRLYSQLGESLDACEHASGRALWTAEEASRHA